MSEPHGVRESHEVSEPKVAQAGWLRRLKACHAELQDIAGSTPDLVGQDFTDVIGALGDLTAVIRDIERREAERLSHEHKQQEQGEQGEVADAQSPQG